MVHWRLLRWEKYFLVVHYLGHGLIEGVDGAVTQRLQQETLDGQDLKDGEDDDAEEEGKEEELDHTDHKDAEEEEDESEEADDLWGFVPPDEVV